MKKKHLIKKANTMKSQKKNVTSCYHTLKISGEILNDAVKAAMCWKHLLDFYWISIHFATRAPHQFTENCFLFFWCNRFKVIRNTIEPIHIRRYRSIYSMYRWFFVENWQEIFLQNQNYDLLSSYDQLVQRISGINLFEFYFRVASLHILHFILHSIRTIYTGGVKACTKWIE